MWDRSNNSETKQANQPGQRSALFIGIDEVALATSSSRYPKLGTQGAGQCIAFAVYDRLTQQAILGHLSSLTENKKQPVVSLLSQMSKGSQAYIVGGMPNNRISQKTLSALTQLFETHDITIKHSDVFRFNASHSASLSIDARSGQIADSNITFDKATSLQRSLDSTEVPPNAVSIVNTNTAEADHVKAQAPIEEEAPSICSIL